MGFIVRTISSNALIAGIEIILSKINQHLHKQKEEEKTCPHCGVVLDEDKKDEV